jgi:hypothetical protein
MAINTNYGEMLIYANSNLKFNADQSNMHMEIQYEAMIY